MSIHRHFQRFSSSPVTTGMRRFVPLLLLPFVLGVLAAQQPAPKLTPAQSQILQGLRGLRQLPDTQRGVQTLQLAQAIDSLPPSTIRVGLATALANLATEGDCGGQPTLQAVTTSLSDALRATPLASRDGAPASPYLTLAQLVAYEHLKSSLQAPQLTAALAQLQAQDAKRQASNFTLPDLGGRQWTLEKLRGKVVLVNFWATWCPPCRREVPELESLQQQFGPRGLIILGVGDEKPDVLQAFASAHHVNYPILLDAGDQVHQQFEIRGIPNSILYDRAGRLVATAIDMRTDAEFRAMLAKAGLK